jgi:hypothetical protein
MAGIGLKIEHPEFSKKKHFCVGGARHGAQ